MPVSEIMTFKIIQPKKEKGKRKTRMQKFMAAKPTDFYAPARGIAR